MCVCVFVCLFFGSVCLFVFVLFCFYHTRDIHYAVRIFLTMNQYSKSQKCYEDDKISKDLLIFSGTNECHEDSLRNLEFQCIELPKPTGTHKLLSTTDPSSVAAQLKKVHSLNVRSKSFDLQTRTYNFS